MLHKILSKVATTSIRDFGCVRVAFPGFNAVGREYYFYKSVDLIFLNDWLDQVNAVRTFMLKCYQLGNPEAIYLRDGSRTRWKCDRCLWQCADWDFCNEIHLTARDWPIGD
ncbi:hypothetical protein Bca4012_075810 [Brassica carinata]